MGDAKANARKSLNKSYGLFHEQVRALALEGGVLLLLQVDVPVGFGVPKGWARAQQVRVRKWAAAGNSGRFGGAAGSLLRTGLLVQDQAPDPPRHERLASGRVASLSRRESPAPCAGA